MFWIRQLQLEVQRFKGVAAALLVLIGLKVVASPAVLPSGVVLLPWRLPWLLLIVLVMLAEPFDRRAFWITRPISRRGLLLGKGIFLLLVGWLPVIVGQTFLLSRQTLPPDILPWLVAETVLRESCLLLLAVAIFFTVENMKQALGVLFVLLLVRVYVGGSGLGWVDPPFVRASLAESTLVACLVTLPALLVFVGLQSSRRNVRQARIRLVQVLLLCLAAVWWLRTHALPWRLDSAPLAPAPWAELDALTFRRVPAAEKRTDLLYFLPGGSHYLSADLELDRPLPRGHGLAVRQLHSTLELPSGRTFDSVLGWGEWLCAGRRDVYADAGLPVPDVSCDPGVAMVPLALLKRRAAIALHAEGSGSVEAVFQLDLFRLEIEAFPLDHLDRSVVADCTARRLERRESGWRPNGKQYDYILHSRAIPSLFRQYLAAEPVYYLVAEGAAEGQGQRLVAPVRSLGVDDSSVKLLTHVPVIQNTIKRVEWDRNIGYSDGHVDPPNVGSTIVCEKWVYVDRTILRQRFDGFSLQELTWQGALPFGRTIADRRK